MKRVFALCALVAASAAALGQSTSGPLGIRVRLAYGFTPSFEANGSSRRMEGPEIAVAIPVGTAFGSDLLLEPSFYGGGRLRSGGDDDADVYRLTLLAHRTLARGIGVRAGVGYASASRSRARTFNGTSGVIFDFGGEFPFHLNQLRSISTFADVHAIFSGEKQLNGFFFGVGARL